MEHQPRKNRRSLVVPLCLVLLAAGANAANAASGSGGPSNACPGLQQAASQVCPDSPACPVIQAQLARHACVAAATCPCNPGTWNVYASFNGIYCFGPEVERLSVCSPSGEPICVKNYGGAAPQTLDPAICAACRAQFPVSAYNVQTTGTQTVSSCSDVSAPLVAGITRGQSAE